jgi:steroid 5-alpha reductase family enzyme
MPHSGPIVGIIMRDALDLAGAVATRVARAAVGAHASASDVDALVALECAAFATWCLVGSWVKGTYSFVDQLWSVTPVVYVGTYAFASEGVARTRLMVMFACACLWGGRLTHNFARKGGYSGEEDYRWGELRKHRLLRHRVAWEIFNVTFIAWYQNVLLLLIALPAAVAHRSTEPFELAGIDGVALAAWATCFCVEVAADEQQWRFQRSKRGFARKVKGWRDDYERGFLTHGLFSLSRHPNFWAEQGMWTCFAGFAAASLESKRFFTPVLTGAVLLILLFQGSTAFTESITARKYPDYEAYQKTTSRLMPFPRLRALPPPATKKA